MAAGSLRVGDRVRLQNLASRQELNGRHGKALRFVKESGRWKVWLDGEAKDTSLALKPENLEALPKYGEALARTILAAQQRSGAASRLQRVHVLGASAWELELQFAALAEAAAPRVGDRVQVAGLVAKPELNGSCGVCERWLAERGRWKVALDDRPGESLVVKPENLQLLPMYDRGGIEGPWLQEGDRHVVRGSRVYGPDGENVEDIVVTGPGSFNMKADGETFTATLSSDGQSLSWSDGDTWVRPAREDALLELVLIGPELPERFASGELERVDWPEPGVSVSCFRGGYEAFAASEGFTEPGLAVLASPSLCAGFFSWAPALQALARCGCLCVGTGSEPYPEGEWLGDGVYDEQLLRACGFEILAPTSRGAHSCRTEAHPTCGWHLWAFALAFRWPQGQSLPEDFAWRAYYQARRMRCELPRFRFRPAAPELKPELLSGDAPQSTRLVEDEDQQDSPDREEQLLMASMEWVGATVQKAWEIGGGECATASAAAAATAAAEDFADRTRSRPLPPGQQHVPACSSCECAARVGAKLGGGGAAVAAAAVVAVFEALAYEALWRQHGCFNPEMVGHIVLGGLKCAERAGFELPAGVASSVGQLAADAYERLSGANQPPLASLVEEFSKLASNAAESAGVGERDAVARAIVDNLDLVIPARGGRDASLRISLKMHDAPPCHKSG